MSEIASPVGIAVAPEAPGWLAGAVREAGARLVPIEEAAGLVWFGFEPEALEVALARAPGVRWVALPSAGVDAMRRLLDDGRTWTAAKGAFAEPVAEHAVALALAGVRHVGVFARRQAWSAPSGRNLYDAAVTVVGGGGIATELVALLRPFRALVTVVRRTVRDMPGAAAVLPPDELPRALSGADVVILAAPLTPATQGMIAAPQLALLPQHAWLVNVGRGGLVVTDDLVDALRAGALGGAALDVTDPEPLPVGHPLWTLPGCIITPHTANTPEMHAPLLAAHVRANVERFLAGRALVGVVDAEAGY